MLAMLKFIFFKSSLIVEVWDYDDVNDDEGIDNFTFPLSSPLNKFNQFDSLTIQGHHRVGNLTLSYGNLTTDPTPCSSMDSPMSSTSQHIQGNVYIQYTCTIQIIYNK